MNLISDEIYRQLVKDSGLNTSLKQLFSHFDTVSDYAVLQEQIQQARAYFMNAQDGMVQYVRSEFSPLAVYMIKDKASSSGGTFLRWRSMQNARTGGTVWQPIVDDESVPVDVRQKVVAVEKDRILINMQISVFNHILRQLVDCAEKLQEVDNAIAKAEL
ncbi:DUF3158 family protein [Mannheimia haemolytica]|uniref:DUF3158 family protein n=2 Tax=Mannheimia haemolytica TaxID=75985 RepID=UPI002EAF1027|nr:DUF3158 family protein [Mannheimia haemolytica]